MNVGPKSHDTYRLQCHPYPEGALLFHPQKLNSCPFSGRVCLFLLGCTCISSKLKANTAPRGATVFPKESQKTKMSGGGILIPNEGCGGKPEQAHPGHCHGICKPSIILPVWHKIIKRYSYKIIKRYGHKVIKRYCCQFLSSKPFV